MIRGIIFDCFGVLYGGSLETFVKMAPHENAKAIHDVNIAKDYGYIDYREYVTQLGELVGIAPAEVERIIAERHVPNRELIDYALSLKATHKVALLSNIGNRLMDELFDGKVRELFDVVELSYEEGLAKPNPAIFQLTADRLGLAPEECVMVDDMPDNCEGAEIVGMKSIQYTSNDVTIARLNELLERQ